MVTTKKPARQRHATAQETEARLRDAGDHLGRMIAYEAAALEAHDRGDQDGRMEAERLFHQEHRAFLAAARTIRNFLIQASDRSGCRDWLDARLSPTICKFHGDVANEGLHDHNVGLAPRVVVRWTADENVPWVADADGRPMMPAEMRVQSVQAIFRVYDETALEPSAREQYQILKREASGDPRIVKLSGDYYHELGQILKNATRNRRFVEEFHTTAT